MPTAATPFAAALLVVLERGSAGAGGDEPVAVAVSLLRALALASGWYLVVVTALGAAARAVGAVRAAAALDGAGPAAARRASRWLAGAVVAAATLVAAVPVGASEEEPPVLRHLPDEPVASRSRASGARSPSTPATVPTTVPPTTVPPTTVPPASVPPAAASPTTVAPAGRPSATPPAPVAADPSSSAAGSAPPYRPVRTRAMRPGRPVARSWTVQPGDHFWSIAERVLSAAWGRAASDAEVAPYWLGLVEANRSRLADPGNPDLVLPGQVMAVPAPPPAPRPARSR